MPKGAHVVKSTSRWIVSAEGTKYYACLRSVGRKVALGGKADYAISGSYVATDLRKPSGDAFAVRDLRSGRRVSAASIGVGTCGTSVARIAVSSRGDMAIGTDVICSKYAQVYRLARGGRLQIAGEGVFDPKTIRISGRTVTWSGGSAPLTAETAPSSCLTADSDPLAATADVRVYLLRHTPVAYACGFTSGKITKLAGPSATNVPVVGGSYAAWPVDGKVAAIEANSGRLYSFDAPNLDAGSLAISGSTLSWTEQGAARSAQLTP